MCACVRVCLFMCVYVCAYKCMRVRVFEVFKLLGILEGY